MNWLTTLTGMPAVAMSPKAGAHGELCGLLAIRAAIQARGETRKRVLVPESAHGTNPATAAFAGFTVDEVPAKPDGHVDADALEGQARPGCGGDHADQSQHLRPVRRRHRRRSPMRCMRRAPISIATAPTSTPSPARCRPGDLGVDAMHINLHKTFSTPHGGGGPGAGPVVLSERSGALRAAAAAGRRRQRLPPDRGCRGGCRRAPSPSAACAPSTARWACSCARSTYMLSHGRDGVRQAIEDAVLSANYILASLKDVMSAPFGEGPCMHEALFDDSFLDGTGVTTLDFAKAMIDEGYHPMTMYFPLVVHGAMLIEPTESEFEESRSTASSMCCAPWRWRRGPERPSASTARRGSPRAAGWTKPRRQESRCCVSGQIP